MTMFARSAGFGRAPLVVTAILIFSALGFVIAACGGGSTETTTTALESGAITTLTEGSGTTLGASETQVIMNNRSYDPTTLTIKAGDTVTWVNHEGVRHDVVADNGEFESDLFDEGESFSFTFTATGTYPYHCSIHRGMEGTIIVE